jgi:hypothetical protein
MRPVVLLAGLIAVSVAPPQPLLAAGRRTAQASPLPLVIRRARENCRVATDTDLVSSRAQALSAYKEFLARLSDVPNGESVGADLRLPALLEELRRESIDLSALENAESTLRRNLPSAKGDDFDRLTATVKHYLRLGRAFLTPDLTEQFTQQMDHLESAVRSYLADRSAENLAAVAEPFDWLLERAQATDVLSKVRQQTLHPNHQMLFSAAFLDRLVGQPLKEPLSSDDTQDGARVRVRGTLDGKLSSALVPDETRGAMHIGFKGVGTSGITAVKGKATVRGRGRTDIVAVQPVYLTTSGFAAGPPRSVVRHHTGNTTVSYNARCRWLRPLMTKVAAKVVAHQQPDSDCKAAARTRRQVEDQLRTESALVVKQANQTLDALGIFAALGPDPATRLLLRTTVRHFEWIGRYASETQFASPAGPPQALPGDHAVLFQAHESAANNSAYLVAGEIVNEADFREVVFSTFGLVPLGDALVEGRIPATITFDDDPGQIRIRDGQLFLSLNLTAVDDDSVGEERGPYTVSTAYKPIVDESGLKLLRTAPISVEPADAPEVEAVRAVLGHFLVPEATAGNKQMLASLLGSATLRMHQLTLADGWLTLSLKLEEGAKP